FTHTGVSSPASRDYKQIIFDTRYRSCPQFKCENMYKPYMCPPTSVCVAVCVCVCVCELQVCVIVCWCVYIIGVCSAVCVYILGVCSAVCVLIAGVYRKSSNKDRDSIRGRASDSSRGRGRYGQKKAGPRIQAGGKKKVPVAYFTVAYQHQSISTKQTSQFI